MAPPSAGVLPAGRWTERGRPKAAPWGTIFPDPISFDSAKRNGVGPPKKSADWPFDVSFYDRRTKTGHTLPPAPLPLMPTKAIPAAAHGRAPDASLRCDQACPEALTGNYISQRSGSRN